MQFSDQSRTWVYLSSREFSDEEVAKLNSSIKNFCIQWAAHGVNLQAYGEVLYHRLILLMVDETRAGASGCSIDSSVHFIQGVEKEYNTQLFNRLLVAFKEGEEVKVLGPTEVKQKIEEGKIDGDSTVFNTAIQTKEQLDHGFIIPLKESWLSRYLKPVNSNSGN